MSALAVTHPSSSFVRFEVGVRVEGYAVGEERRHVNSAFYIFQATEENVILPKLVAETEVCV